MVLTATAPSKVAQSQQRLTKTTVIEEVAARLGTSKAQTKRVLEAMLTIITESLENDVKITLTGFGSFETRTYKARQGRHPQTGSVITIPTTKRAVFSAGAALKRAIKNN